MFQRVLGEGKMLFSFTPKHLRPFFRHRGEGSEGKKHNLIVYVRVRVCARAREREKRMRAREKTTRARKKQCERHVDRWQRKSERSRSVIGKLLRHQKSKTSLPLRFFSYAVAPTSEIVFSTSDPQFGSHRHGNTH